MWDLLSFNRFFQINKLKTPSDNEFIEAFANIITHHIVFKLLNNSIQSDLMQNTLANTILKNEVLDKFKNRYRFELNYERQHLTQLMIYYFQDSSILESLNQYLLCKYPELRGKFIKTLYDIDEIFIPEKTRYNFTFNSDIGIEITNENNPNVIIDYVITGKLSKDLLYQNLEKILESDAKRIAKILKDNNVTWDVNSSQTHYQYTDDEIKIIKQFDKPFFQSLIQKLPPLIEEKVYKLIPNRLTTPTNPIQTQNDYFTFHNHSDPMEQSKALAYQTPIPQSQLISNQTNSITTETQPDCWEIFKSTISSFNTRQYNHATTASHIESSPQNINPNTNNNIGANTIITSQPNTSTNKTKIFF